MSANLSLMLNLGLLFIVIIAISRLIKAQRQHLIPKHYQPSLGGAADNQNQYVDEIIAVRKLTEDLDSDEESSMYETEETLPEQTQMAHENHDDSLFAEETARDKSASQSHSNLDMIMMFLLAKDQRQFAGYELLQTVLAAGMRFGEGDIFHRHQYANGQGPVIFSLASATASGTFDLQNIGAFSERGLCLFMQPSGNSAIDLERFNIFYDTAKQLSEGLDAHLLDAERRPWTNETLGRYQRALNAGSEISA